MSIEVVRSPAPQHEPFSLKGGERLVYQAFDRSISTLAHRGRADDTPLDITAVTLLGNKVLAEYR